MSSAREGKRGPPLCHIWARPEALASRRWLVASPRGAGRHVPDAPAARRPGNQTVNTAAPRRRGAVPGSGGGAPRGALRRAGMGRCAASGASGPRLPSAVTPGRAGAGYLAALPGGCRARPRAGGGAAGLRGSPPSPARVTAARLCRVPL